MTKAVATKPEPRPAPEDTERLEISLDAERGSYPAFLDGESQRAMYVLPLPIIRLIFELSRVMNCSFSAVVAMAVLREWRENPTRRMAIEIQEERTKNERQQLELDRQRFDLERERADFERRKASLQRRGESP